MLTINKYAMMCNCGHSWFSDKKEPNVCPKCKQNKKIVPFSKDGHNKILAVNKNNFLEKEAIYLETARKVEIRCLEQ